MRTPCREPSTSFVNGVKGRRVSSAILEGCAKGSEFRTVISCACLRECGRGLGGGWEAFTYLRPKNPRLSGLRPGAKNCAFRSLRDRTPGPGRRLQTSALPRIHRGSSARGRKATVAHCNCQNPPRHDYGARGSAGTRELHLQIHHLGLSKQWKEHSHTTTPRDPHACGASP